MLQCVDEEWPVLRKIRRNMFEVDIAAVLVVAVADVPTAAVVFFSVLLSF